MTRTIKEIAGDKWPESEIKSAYHAIRSELSYKDNLYHAKRAEIHCSNAIKNLEELGSIPVEIPSVDELKNKILSDLYIDALQYTYPSEHVLEIVNNAYKSEQRKAKGEK